MRRTGLVGGIAAIVLIAGGAVGVLAASGDLPWQGRAAEVAKDGTSVPPSASPETPPAAVTPRVTFTNAFPQLGKLDRPTNMIEVPGQHLFLVTLQDGRVVSIPKDSSAKTATTVLDLRAKVSRDGNEEGLLGIALPPRASSADVYLYYSAKPGERRTVLSGFSMSGAGTSLTIDPASEQPLLTVPQPFPNHKGGQLAFGPDGMLYLGLGDGGSGGDPNGNGQDLKANLLASILRIDVHVEPGQPYRIPADNPFATSPNGQKPETWAYGLRNPWRFSFDRETGKLWAGDVGQDNWEELDIIERGGNYGWNIMEGFHCYKPASGCNQQGLILPVAEYSHDAGACSVTGGYVYHGAAIPSLRGWYVYGDYCSGAVWAIPATSLSGSKPTPVVLRSSGNTIASFAQDNDGELYLLGGDGAIMRLAP